MTSDRDFERILDKWLADGPTGAADRVIDDVAGRISRQSQRPAWLVSWRDYHVSPNAKPFLAVGAVVVIVVAGFAIFGGPLLPSVELPATASTSPSPAISPSPEPSPSPSPSPSPEATPSPSPTSTPILITGGGALAGGWYRFIPFESRPTLTIDANVPRAWQAIPKWAITGPDGAGGPAGVGIAFLLPTGVYSDPCDWAHSGDSSSPQDGDIPINGTIDELVTALSSNAYYRAGPVTDSVLAGYPAKQIVLQLPPVMFSKCDQQIADGDFRVFGGSDGTLAAQDYGNRWQVSIIDVAGARVIVVLGDYARTSATDRAAAEGILNSLVVKP